MDRTPITSALVTAKAIVTAHGISNYLAQHMRAVAARPVEPTDSAFRLDYVLDPSKSVWQDNPGCSIHVGYVPSGKGQRTTEEGGVVHDYLLSISVRASTDDMSLARFKEREAMISKLAMLCEMLEVSLPPTVTLVVMTPEQLKDKTQTQLEQTTGALIHESLGRDAFKGLRKGGRPRLFHNPSNSNFPTGSYRYTQVRRMNSRGCVVDSAKYIITIRGESLLVRRTE